MEYFSLRSAAAFGIIASFALAGCGGGSAQEEVAFDESSAELAAPAREVKKKPRDTTTTPPATDTTTTPSTPTTTVTWVRCAAEGGECAVPGTAEVRYGLDGRWATRTATNSIACNNTVFGDPYPGVAKVCEYASTGSGSVPVTPPTTGTSGSGAMKGVNISGAEFNNDKPYGTVNTNYVYPSQAQIDYYAAKGMKLIRLPFAGARLQPVNNAPLADAELARIASIVDYAATKGMQVVIDPHDYGMKYDSTTGTMRPLGTPSGLPASVFADFWSRLAVAFKAKQNVIFGLMNEPANQSAAEWKAVAVAGINAIRATGATQKILIPGASWTGAHSWVSSGNAAAWTGFTEAGNNFAFEMHQYLDSDSSGTQASCTAGSGSTRLVAATNWARTNGYKVFLGEVGWSTDASCTPEAKAIMSYMTSNADVWEGWAYWTSGQWYPSTYMFMLDPLDFRAPVDRPQMSILTSHL